MAGISEGLTPGETVVVEGQGSLMQGTLVEVARVDPRLARGESQPFRQAGACRTMNISNCSSTVQSRRFC